MFTDPTTITISTVATPLPRVSVGEMKAGYRSADGALSLTISHTANNRERSVIKLTRNKVGTDPLDASKGKNYTTSWYLVNDSPLNGAGFTDAELEADAKGLLALITSTGFLAKFLGKES